MKVRIVCYEDVNTWILGKFALKVQENLLKLGIDADVAKVTDKNADINHHIVYVDYDATPSTIDTLMITHVDTIEKMKRLERQMRVAAVGICMSKHTMDTLIDYGIPKNKLCFVNPAHDGLIKPRKIIVGFSSRYYADGRKREYFITRLSEKISPLEFSFKIMGDGWNNIVSDLTNKGFEVEYYNKFDYQKYIDFIPTLDYYLYTGMDEGQMGFIDALAAGVPTIVTPQGYHLDALGGISHSFNSFDELNKVFEDISSERKKRIEAVSTWNWYDYTLKHLEIWKYLLSPNIYRKSNFYDGLNFLLRNQDADEFKFKKVRKFKLKYKITNEFLRQFVFINRRLKFLKKFLQK